jgi:hypothetical protein
MNASAVPNSGLPAHGYDQHLWSPTHCAKCAQWMGHPAIPCLEGETWGTQIYCGSDLGHPPTSSQKGNTYLTRVDVWQEHRAWLIRVRPRRFFFNS